jgi:capsular polysaccharide biosynthesis protein
MLLAALGGLALAFLLDYLDSSVRDRTDLQRLGIDLLGEVPRG